MINKVAFCVKTFSRPQQVERLIKSIKRFYPKAKIYIADDSLEPMKGSFAMEFDSGLSAGRNLLIENTTEPYLLFLDDDFVFTKDTKIEKFLELLEKHKDIGLVGGMLREMGQEIHYEGFPRLNDCTLTYEKSEIGKKKFIKTGMVLNFFLARREMFDSIRWDSDLKLAEHTDFFLRLSYTRWKVGYTNQVVVAHCPNKSGEYKKFRSRGKQFMRLFMKKRNIKKIINFKGEVYV